MATLGFTPTVVHKVTAEWALAEWALPSGRQLDRNETAGFLSTIVVAIRGRVTHLVS
jgi:hypothetical protein